MSFLTEVKFIGKSDKPRPSIFFKSKNVIMATGAVQTMQPNLRSIYHIKESATTFSSDYVLKSEGFL